MWGNTELSIFVVLLSSVQVVFLAPPVLDPIPTPVVTLLESEKREQLLVSDITCSDPDGDPTRVHIRSVDPLQPCGECFHIWPCGTDKYCLMFEPSLGTLLYGSVTSYLLLVTCTDDIDDDVSSRVIDVRLTANTPPSFIDPGPAGVATEIKHTMAASAGDVVYDVNAHDVDSDAVYYTMTTEPDTDLFEVGYGDGKIRVMQDLRQLCQDTVTFRVNAADSHHAPVGPAIVQTSLKNRNHRPVITKSKTLIETPENKDVSFKIKVQDKDGDDVMFRMRAVPERGLEYYTIGEKGTIRSRKTLDYEYPLLRSVRLYVDVTDGFCDSETFSVTVRITDVNEPPVIVPNDVERTVYEGLISVDPGWRVEDPDSLESHEWSSLSGDGGQLRIDTTTGIVHSIGELDIDPLPQKKFTYKVEVKDRDNVKDTATLRLTVLDKNDHVPAFHKHLYTFTASNCTKVGSILGNLHARDKDSEFQGNNLLVYSGSGPNLSVLSTGGVTLKTPCTVGRVDTIEGYVTDQGLYPGPLSGVPTTITVRCNPCPEPVPPESTTTNTSTSTTRTITISPGQVFGSTDDLASNLAWIMVAILLAITLATLLAFFICRQCLRACSRWRQRRALRAKSRPSRKKKQPKSRSRESSIQKKEPPEPPAVVKPVPPVPPPPDTEPFFFGFWKETFMDRDQRHMPQRDVIPATVEKDREVEKKEKEEEEKEKETRREERRKAEEQYRQQLEIYQQEVNALANPPPPSLPPPAPAKKKKFCHIM